MIFIKTHTQNYLQSWDDSLFRVSKIFSLSFSYPHASDFFSRLPHESLFFGVCFCGSFKKIFTKVYENFSPVSFIGIYKIFHWLFNHFRQTHILFIYTFEPSKAEAQRDCHPVLCLLALRTFKLKLKTCVEKCFVFDTFGKLWKIWSCAVWLLLVFNDFSGVRKMRRELANENYHPSSRFCF